MLHNGFVQGAGVNPRLLVVSGPLKESIFPLSGAAIPIGRDSSNKLAISDPALSRRHCLIYREENEYKIRDLESRNGTFVNGTAIRDVPLQHGDQISVGDSVFILLLRDDTAEPARASVEFEDRPTHATAQLSPRDVLYLQHDRILKELPSAFRLGRDLSALLKISRLVHAIRDLDELQAKILDLIFEVIPAERGAILLESKSDGQFGAIFARHRLPGISKPVPISRTITRQVLEAGCRGVGHRWGKRQTQRSRKSGYF